MMAPQRQAEATTPPSFVLTGAGSSEPPNTHTDDADSAIGDTSSPENAKSQCSSMSDGENYECYGEGVDLELDADPPAPILASNGPPSLGRNSWLRTSLRRTPASNQQETSPNRRWGSFRHSSGKRIGSNALASQLYRSSSFNSSGRSSNCDTADDMYSDVSLEEDVLDLNHKVQMLQQQMTVLADSHTNTDDRYTRAKQDSAALQARVHMLEEQLRECELRSEDRLAEEQKRHRELLSRVEREKQQQLENCAGRLQSLESESATLREESTRLRIQLDRLRVEKEAAQDKLDEAQSALSSVHHDVASVKDIERRVRDEAAREMAANVQLVEVLSKEVERLRSQKSADGAGSPNDRSSRESELESRLVDLQSEVTCLHQQNKDLAESNEELQAQLLSRSLEEGRHLLTGTSLAAEFEAMSHGESSATADELSFDQVRNALIEQQEVNSQLRAYIDGILLNIVENYPQLLEVKMKH